MCVFVLGQSEGPRERHWFPFYFSWGATACLLFSRLAWGAGRRQHEAGSTCSSNTAAVSLERCHQHCHHATALLRLPWLFSHGCKIWQTPMSVTVIKLLEAYLLWNACYMQNYTQMNIHTCVCIHISMSKSQC